MVLEPGDQLYIPPCHFHSVEVLGNESAASTNVYLEAPHKATLARLFALEPPIPRPAVDVPGEGDGVIVAACFFMHALEQAGRRGCCGGLGYGLGPYEIVKGVLGASGVCVVWTRHS